MTAASKLRKRGWEAGVIVGREEGKRLGSLATAKNMFQFGISKEEILQITGLEREVILEQSIQREHLNSFNEKRLIVEKVENRSLAYNVIVYLLETDEVNDPDELINTIINVLPDKKESIMDIALAIKDEGWKEGVIVGREEGEKLSRLATVKNMLTNKFDIDLISELTGTVIHKKLLSLEGTVKIGVPDG